MTYSVSRRTLNPTLTHLLRPQTALFRLHDPHSSLRSRSIVMSHAGSPLCSRSLSCRPAPFCRPIQLCLHALIRYTVLYALARTSPYSLTGKQYL